MDQLDEIVLGTCFNLIYGRLFVRCFELSDGGRKEKRMLISGSAESIKGFAYLCKHDLSDLLVLKVRAWLTLSRPRQREIFSAHF